jgi:hypothetical protein
MDLGAFGKLERLGGPTLRRYRELTAAADMSAADSPAAMAKARFERDWMADPIALTQHCEQEAGA